MEKSIFYLDTENNEPILNIQVFGAKRFVDFKFNPADYDIVDHNGRHILLEVDKDRMWRVKIKQAAPSKYEYYLILKESLDSAPIQAEFNHMQKMHTKLKVIGVGGDIFINRKKVNNNYINRLVAGPFISLQEAINHSQDYGPLNHCSVFRKLVEQGKGIIEIYDPQYEFFEEVQNGIKLIPKNSQTSFELSHFEINHPRPGEKVKRKNLVYHGEFKIMIDENGSISGITRIPVEQYLKGVLRSELEDPANLEFTKCMAVVFRSNIFASIGINHPGEPYDFCNDSHCLRYYGKSLANPIIDKAVELTRGQVLEMDEQSICRAHCHYCCGGHTENANEVWLCHDYQYNTGKYDGVDGVAEGHGSLNLRTEIHVKKWISNRPEVNCKPDPAETNKITELSSDAFRWEVYYTRSELEKLLREKTGEDPGIIYEIIPLKRGVSGRLKEIEILGSQRNIRIIGETNIRMAFSENLLNSSCFYIQQEMDDDSVPVSFTFIGAGKGHGVGLCKNGALHMALYQESVENILKHYFEKSKLVRIYN